MSAYLQAVLGRADPQSWGAAFGGRAGDFEGLGPLSRMRGIALWPWVVTEI
jgi:hypothetical protein